MGCTRGKRKIYFGGYVYLEELPSKHLYAHDGEDEPKYQADEQHVEDGWDGLDEGIDDDLITNVAQRSNIFRGKYSNGD